MVVTTPITIPDQGVVIVSGNFTLDPMGTLVVIVSQNTVGGLDVDGCVELQGTLQVVFRVRPTDGLILPRVIKVTAGTGNCLISGEFSNIVIVNEYGDAACDKISADPLGDDTGSTLSLLIHVEDTCGHGNQARTRWIIIGSAVGGVMLVVGIALVIVYFAVKRGHLRRLRPLFFWIEDTGDEFGVELR